MTRHGGSEPGSQYTENHISSSSTLRMAHDVLVLDCVLAVWHLDRHVTARLLDNEAPQGFARGQTRCYRGKARRWPRSFPRKGGEPQPRRANFAMTGGYELAYDTAVITREVSLPAILLMKKTISHRGLPHRCARFGRLCHARPRQVQTRRIRRRATRRWILANSGGALHEQLPERGPWSEIERSELFPHRLDVFADEGKAAVKGDAGTYSWTNFDKDIRCPEENRGSRISASALSGLASNRRKASFNEAAIRQYAEMARKLRDAGIEPIVTLWHFTFPDWLYNRYDKREVTSSILTFKKNGYLRDQDGGRAQAYVRYWVPQNEPNGALPARLDCRALAAGHPSEPVQVQARHAHLRRHVH